MGVGERKMIPSFVDLLHMHFLRTKTVIGEGSVFSIKFPFYSYVMVCGSPVKSIV